MTSTPVLLILESPPRHNIYHQNNENQDDSCLATNIAMVAMPLFAIIVKNMRYLVMCKNKQSIRIAETKELSDAL